MIPLRDNIRSERFPAVTVSLILLNALVFIYELSLGPGIEALVYRFGVVPSNVVQWPASGQGFAGVALPYLTSMFLHGGWLHLIGNMWYLWIFGDNVEDRLGHARYLIFYLVVGLAGGVAHTVANPYAQVPTVGASGAIAGVLGAYLILYPHARVLTLVPIFFFIQFIEIPALIVLGLWFLLQFLEGATAVGTAAASGGGVAWWAHIGGFLVGMALVLLMTKPRWRWRRKRSQSAKT